MDELNKRVQAVEVLKQERLDKEKMLKLQKEQSRLQANKGFLDNIKTF